MNQHREKNDEGATPDVAVQLLHLKRLSLKNATAAMERSAREKCMLAGSLAARLAAQTAALDTERAKVALLEAQLQRQGARFGGRPASSSCTVSSQTEDDAEAVAAELARLHRTRDELVAATQGMPHNSQNMVELFKKRNKALLAREERGLQRLRAERLEKEKRVAQLEQRLCGLKASSS